MQKPDLPQNPSPAHPTRRGASTEPAELEIIVPTNPPAHPCRGSSVDASPHRTRDQVAGAELLGNKCRSPPRPRCNTRYCRQRQSTFTTPTPTGRKRVKVKPHTDRRVDLFMPLGARSRTSASADYRVVDADQLWDHRVDVRHQCRWEEIADDDGAAPAGCRWGSAARRRRPGVSRGFGPKMERGQTEEGGPGNA